MLSRVAESLYWFGRYMERAEDIGRIIDVNAQLLLDLPRGIAPGWEPIIAITGSRDEFVERYGDFTEANAIRFLLVDADNSGSLIASLACARENARTMRDFLPREAWELVNELYLFARDEVSAGQSKRGRHGYLKQISRDANSLDGLLRGAMNQDQGQRFLSLGRLLERADMTTRIIDVRSANLLPNETSELLPFENIQWMSVLKSLTAYQMYRRKMQVRVRRSDALQFLLLDDEFPRAVYQCIQVVDENMEQLPGGDAPRHQVARVKRMLQGADIEEMAESNDVLHKFIDEVQIGLGEVHQSIVRTYFLYEPEALVGSESQTQTQTQTQSSAAAP